MTFRRPPVIPEIAKAYQNDPRTVAALAAAKDGSSTAPVAAGGYGVAEGIARALQGVAGGYMAGRNQDAYRHGDYSGPDVSTLAPGSPEWTAAQNQRGEDGVLAIRENRGADGLTGALPPAAAPMPSAAPLQPPGAPPAGPTAGIPLQGPVAAPAMAAALGVPAPSAPAPALFPGGLQFPQPQGGAPMGSRPFAQGIDLSSGRDQLLNSGAKITSGYRTPEHNAEVGGVDNSWHTRGTSDNPLAYDFVPGQGGSMDALAAQARAAYPGFTVINEGNHVHVQPPHGTSMDAIAHALQPSSAPGPSTPYSHQAEATPDAPAPMERPVAPVAEGPTRSRTLTAAYQIMKDANPYESAGGQDMYSTGLGEQTKLDESAAERKQRLADMGYQSDLGAYTESKTQDRGAAIAERAATQQRNFTGNEDAMGRQATANEGAANRANAITIQNLSAQNAWRVAKLKAESDASGDSNSLTTDERAALSKAVGDKRIDLKGITKFQAKVAAQALVDNPNLDAIHLHALANLASNPPAQTKAMLLQSVPEVLQSIRDAGKDLNFSNIKPIGDLQAFIKNNTSDPKYSKYMSLRNDGMQTLAQVMGGVGASDMRVNMEKEAARVSASPGAWDGWFGGQLVSVIARARQNEARGLIPKGSTAELENTLAAHNRASGLAGGAPVPSSATPSGGVAMRKPGETVSQYLARTGG